MAALPLGPRVLLACRLAEPRAGLGRDGDAR